MFTYSFKIIGYFYRAEPVSALSKLEVHSYNSSTSKRTTATRSTEKYPSRVCEGNK